MVRKRTDKDQPEKITIEPPKPRKRVPPPSRPLKDRRKAAERRRTREKIRPEQDED